MNRSLTRLTLIVALLLAIPTAAFAHAILVSSTPAIHGTVPAGTINIQLHFNSRVDGARSRVTLNAASDADASHPLPLDKLTQSAPDTFLTAAHLPPGAYVLHWIALAGDGHITRGQIPFTVR